MKTEIFKDIEWYEWSYQVSNLWRIKSLKHNKEKILKTFINKDWYEWIFLRKNLESKNCLVHRMVMYWFEWMLDFEVNHIDWNKLNNNLENLEYCTRSYNIAHYNDCLK